MLCSNPQHVNVAVHDAQDIASAAATAVVLFIRNCTFLQTQAYPPSAFHPLEKPDACPGHISDTHNLVALISTTAGLSTFRTCCAPCWPAEPGGTGL